MEDVPPEVVQKETDIEMGKEDITKKPENIRCRGACFPHTWAHASYFSLPSGGCTVPSSSKTWHSRAYIL